MFQTFDSTTSPETGAPRLAALRAEMANRQLSGYLVPRADAHQGEYVAPCDERLAWLTSFTGSAGFCAVLENAAGVFIDGRYRVQVKDQVDLAVFEPVPWPETQLGPWLIEREASGRIGFDPWLHTKREIDAVERALEDQDVTLVAVPNLIDLIWQDRPPAPSGLAEIYPIELAGRSSADKRTEISEVLKTAGHSAAVLTLPDSIAWLLNIRGTDIARIPIVQAFAILFDDTRVELFSNPAKFSEISLGPDVKLRDFSEFNLALTELNGSIRVEKSSAPLQISNILKNSDIVYDDDPCGLPKACKNPVEIEGARAAHLRDAHAMVEFLAWLDMQEPGAFTEIDVVTQLEGFRTKTNALRDISFETISGTGPNGAIVHYRVTHETNRRVEDGNLLLVDSGGQYVDGTTDITRTIAIGTPSPEQIRCYTLVLKGMVSLSMARFPTGISGRDLDPLARAALWRDGLDYDHGTGHGVGAFLSVHEGPQRIARISEVKLAPGMILSNEPGYYREGAFGIRIENLIVVQSAPKMGDNRDQLSFETLTYVPFDRRLIDPELLSPQERAWIDDYNAEIARRIAASPAANAWLAKATAPL
ncbi:MAG: aminopeptidase P family protein [Pseudomonadota bacterium]